MTKKAKRFRPTLKAYRKIQDEKSQIILDYADSQIELSLLRKENERNKREYQIQEAISKDLMERKTALEGKVAEHEKVYEHLRYDLNCTDAHFQDTWDKLKSLKMLSFVLAFVTIAYSAIQIAQCF